MPFGGQTDFNTPAYRSQTKTNFWDENLEVPLSHSYSSNEDLKNARSCLARWSEEWREKKASEMSIFNGKREININEGETASSMSQSRVSHKQEKANKLAQEAQKEFGGIRGSRKAADGRKVNFEEPGSPGLHPDFRDGEGEGKAEIRELDKLLK